MHIADIPTANVLVKRCVRREHANEIMYTTHIPIIYPRYMDKLTAVAKHIPHVVEMRKIRYVRS